MADLRVVLNASSVPANPGGAGVYALELARALDQADGIDLTVATGVAHRGWKHHEVTPQGDARAAAWEQTKLPVVLRELEADVCHGTHFARPLRGQIPNVVTVHDLTFFRMPKRYPRGRAAYYRLLARIARGAHRVIVPSSSVASDAVRLLQLEPSRIRVIAEAPRAWLRPATPEAICELRSRLRLDRPYLLTVGSGDPLKRGVDAVRALLRIRGVRDVTLVLAGGEGVVTPALRREVDRLGLSEHVRLTGYVQDRDLAALLTGAEALIYGSLYEGFGLPPLEAMACGAPVIAAKAAAMDEVLGDAAAFFEPRKSEGLARQVIRLLSDPAWADELRARGRERAATYSWGRAAAETIEVYRGVARR